MDPEITKAARAIVMEYVDIPGCELEFTIGQVADIIKRETKLPLLLGFVQRLSEVNFINMEASERMEMLTKYVLTAKRLMTEITPKQEIKS